LSLMLNKRWNNNNNNNNQNFKEENLNTIMLSILSDQNDNNNDCTLSPFLFEHKIRKQLSTSSRFYDLLTKNFTNYYQNIDDKIHENDDYLKNENNQFIEHDLIMKKKYRNSWPTMLNKQSTIACLSKSFDILNKLNNVNHNQQFDDNDTKLTFNKYKRPLPWSSNDKTNSFSSKTISNYTHQFVNENIIEKLVTSNKTKDSRIINTSLSCDLSSQ
ncbi:unnamed protein product, partial [Didymodactylos carnosus]